MTTVVNCEKCLKDYTSINKISIRRICDECFENNLKTMKICKECKIEKPMTEYYKNLQFKDGKFNICVECFNLKRKLKIKKEIKKETEKKTNENNYCKEFFLCKIIKTKDQLDKITATNLYIKYKKYLSENNYKCFINQQTFKNIMSEKEYLSLQYGSSWVGVKILNI